MLLQTMIVILVGVVTITSDILLRSNISRGSRNDNDRGQGGMLLMVIGVLLIILAPIFATLLKLAISRKREFLADASGALLTRYPEGLARALEKIAADPNQLRTASDATAHLYIASPFRKTRGGNWLHKIFATHPPVEERIAALRGLRV
jgi:heat shock protein HtpX